MEGGIWWVIIGAVVALVVAAIVISIVKGGLFAGKENVDALSSCQNQGGECKTKENCGSDSNKFFKFGGCPDDEDSSEEDVYCCIPKKAG